MGYFSKVLMSAGVAALTAGMALQAADAADLAGVRNIEVPSATRGTHLDVTVWYPASSGGTSEVLGESVFFEGTPALRDAQIPNETFPVILLSHGAGLGGRAEAMSWIAAPLAERGFVVAAPTHPANTGPDRSAAETMKLWLRPTDISETLDAIVADPFFEDHLDTARVGVLGLSMGGNTALALAGARIDPERLASYCDTDARNPSLCDWVTQSGVDLHAMDMTPAGLDYTDARVVFAMAIDPALVDVLAPHSFSRIAIPVSLVNLGRPGEIPVTVDASGIATSVPDAAYAVIEDASHFSMFGVCKPGASDIAAEEGIEEPICADGGARSRSAVHDQLIDMVAGVFEEALKGGR